MSICFYMYLSNVVPRPYCAWLRELSHCFDVVVISVRLDYQPLFEKGARVPSLFSAKNVHARADSRKGRNSSRYFSLIRIVSVRLTSVRST